MKWFSFLHFTPFYDKLQSLLKNDERENNGMPFQQRGMVTGCKPSWRGSVWFALEFRRGNTLAVGPPLWDKEVRAGLLREIRVVPRKSLPFVPLLREERLFYLGGNSMKEQLEKVKQDALAALAAAKETVDLENIRVKYLGKKGELTALLKQMGKLSAEERPVMGQLANEVRAELEERASKPEDKSWRRSSWRPSCKAEALDVTIPGKQQKLGPPAPHVYRAGRDQGHLRRHGL